MTMDIALSSYEEVHCITTTAINYGNDDMIVEPKQTQRRSRSPSPTGVREQLQHEQRRSIIFGAFFRNNNQKAQRQQQKLEQKQQQQQQQQQSSQQATTNTKRRSVRFVSGDENMIQEIEHVSSISENERITRWYNRQEYSTIKLQYNIIAKRMNTGACKFLNGSGDDDEIIVEQYDENGILMSNDNLNDDVTKKDCTRGLEHKTREGSRKRSFNKHNGLDAVLLEQQRQMVRCNNDSNHNNRDSSYIFDAKAIADVYMNEGRTAKESALILAAKDAKFAQKYAKEPITSSTSSPHTMASLNTKINHFLRNNISNAATEVTTTNVPTAMVVTSVA